ncbi:MAG TPA: hypothetical protein VMD05_07825 [Candidatus Nanoarchaeia archaeon]|nr:hypothetical protein [Candidatus Nanoarchaeia archaeon]
MWGTIFLCRLPENILLGGVLLTKPIITIEGRFLKCLNKLTRRNPTLTIRGFFVSCGSTETPPVQQKFDWGNALIDAVITMGITFFSALAGSVGAGDVHPIHIVETATIAAFSQFFVFLALKRGLVKLEDAQHKLLLGAFLKSNNENLK